MLVKGRTILSLSLALVLATLPATLAYADSWPQFRHDPGHSGVSTSTGPDQGELKWSYQAGGRIYSSPAVTRTGQIVFGCSDTNLYSLDANGTLLWTFPTGGEIVSSPGVWGNGVFFSSNDGVFYALTISGQLAWSYPFYSAQASSPNKLSGGSIVFGGGHAVYHLGADGSLLWKFPVGGAVVSTPAVDDRDNIYFGCYDFSAYSIDRDGQLRWSYPTGNQVAAAPAVAKDGTSYFAGRDSSLYVFDRNGALLRTHTFAQGLYASPIITSTGKLFVACDDGTLTSYDADGFFRWRYKAKGSIHSSPAMDALGRIYFGSDDRSMYCLSPTGFLGWSYPTRGVIWSSPALGPDGSLYFGGWDRSLYAFLPPRSTPTPTPTATPTSRAGPVLISMYPDQGALGVDPTTGIGGALRDEGEGVDLNSIVLVLDGNTLPVVSKYDDEEERIAIFYAQPPTPLSLNHRAEVYVYACDRAQLPNCGGPFQWDFQTETHLPSVYLGGFLDSTIVSGEFHPLHTIMFADPGTERLELGIGGQATGYTLQSIYPGIFVGDTPFGGNLPRGPVLFEFLGTGYGVTLPTWPYFTVLP